MDVPNIPDLASELARILGPYLPYLVETGKTVGGKAVEEVGKKAGGEAFDGAKRVWKRLRGKVEETPRAAEAVRDLAEDPEDADLQAAVRVQLRKILAADPGLVGEMAKLLQTVEIEGSGNAVAQVGGDGNVVVQGNGNVTAGAGGTAAGGDLTQNFIEDSRPGPDKKSLRSSYLRKLIAQTSHLTLSGVDPNVAGSEKDARLSLNAVYTGLMTLSWVEESLRRKDEKSMVVPPENRRYSALEQLDQHRQLVLLGDPGGGKTTFVNFVALCMAGEILGLSDIGLDLLTSPLPDDKGNDQKERQPWGHGALLPVRVVLRDFAARGLPKKGRAAAQDLWDFLESEWKRDGFGDCFPHLRAELLSSGGLFLFDGLDEVPEAENRREQIREVVESFVGALPPSCRVLVTSRVFAYRNQGWQLRGFTESTLAPFSDGQIRRFVDRWYTHVAPQRKLEPEIAEARAGRLKEAIFRSERLHELAERPLLLALMASLHAWRGGNLPEGREELYAGAVDLLLHLWESQRETFDSDGVPVQQPSLSEFLEVGKEKVRQVLQELAFQAHASQQDATGTADIPAGVLVDRLMGLSRAQNPRLLVDYLRERTGLLEARGEGVYAFPHRTFQEYLSACHLTGGSFPKEIADLARKDPLRWREVLLLAGAKVAKGATASVWQLVEALCQREPDPEGGDLSDLWGAHLAGLVVAESVDLEDIAEWNRPKLERLRRWLVRLLRDKRLPAVERALAGESLARLGDPRAEVMTVGGIELYEVPAGRFWMGSADEDSQGFVDEKPRHEVEIPYPFQMARFPVTVAQFREAVESGGVELQDPQGLGRPANQPMTVVSWQEAGAFCAWLTGKWREERRIGRDWEVRLPTEAEWEKAARGTEGQEYPWGNEFEADRANARETGIGRPSAVGCFPGGESPFHCEEMSGNVWEWTLSFDEDYPYRLRDRSEIIKDNSDRLRVWRGGSYFAASWFVRCAYRYRDAADDRPANIGFRVVAAPFSSEL